MGLLSFRANAESFHVLTNYRSEVLVLLVTILKYLNTSSSQKKSLVKKINAKQFPTHVKVHLLTALLSRRSKSMVLDDYGIIP